MFSRRSKDHLEPLRTRVRGLSTHEPPTPWQKLASRAVGGLQAGGFDRSGDFLLLVSVSGRGVLDCKTGELVAREPGDLTEAELDTSHLDCRGIGPLAEEVVRVAGLHGGGMLTLSPAGWTLEALAIDWPDVSIVLVEPWKSVYDTSAQITKIGVESQVRFAGFSPSGHCLVLGTSAEISLWRAM